jgi:hypothetical protein
MASKVRPFPELTLQPIPVFTASADEDGRLVLADGHLVAVLVRLSDDNEPHLRGSWFLEAGFGLLDNAVKEIFLDLEHARTWIYGRLVARR